MDKLILTIAMMTLWAVIMGRILFWIDKSRLMDHAAGKLMDIFPWQYEELKASLIGIWYYITPLLFIIASCFVYDFPIWNYFRISFDDLFLIPITMCAEISIITLLSGSLTLLSETVDWSQDIGNISWIQSIHKRNRRIAPFVPILGAFVEELFFRGTIFLILYINYYEILGFWGATAVSAILFAVEQALFTDKKSQCLSMLLGSIGISLVACTSVAYTESILPCLLAHECFLVFYFGKFKYY